ncbi:MAG: acetyl-coenzyme synthetase, partial [Sphingomonas bacterium]|nr:acetyl-coenzyme synthetase [Sphingomonas bacterium]
MSKSPNGLPADTIDAATRDALYTRSLAEPDAFWLEQAKRLDWIDMPEKAGDWSFDEADFHVRWFADGTLNVAANCIDRHLAERAEQTAIIWEPDDPAEQPRRFTYAELHGEVCRFANVLKALGTKKGDRVTVYMPMIPEAAFALLACARIGAVHSVVFGGFSPDALAGRIQDCDSTIVITADEGRRGGKRVPLKANVDEAAKSCPGLKTVLVVRATGGHVATLDHDVWYHDAARDVGADCPAEPMNAEDPLFILYTSGSTGKPKGVVHTTGGYAVWVGATFYWIFGPTDD